MKTIALLLSLIFSATALAGLPPTTLKGQSGTKATTFNFEVPNNLATKTSTGGLIENGNNNILANPSFEAAFVSNAVPAWTTGGTVTAPTSPETSTVIHGKQALCFSTAANTITLTQDSSINAAQFADGTVQGMLGVRLKFSHTGDVTLCSRRAGVTSTTDCQTITQAANGNKWALYRIPFMFGATSQGISISAASGTGTLCVDDATVEMAKDFDQVPALTTERACTFSSLAWTGLGTVTNNLRCTRIGQLLFMSGTVTMGATSANAIAIPLPTWDGQQLSTSSQITATHVKGNLWRHAASTAGMETAIAGSSSTTFSVSNHLVDAANNPITGVNGNAVFNTSDVVSFNLWFTIEGWGSSINTYTDQCSTDIACSNSLSAKITSAGAIANQQITSALSSTSGSAGVYTITYSNMGLTTAPSVDVLAETPCVQHMISVAATTTSVEITTRNNSGTATACAFDVTINRQGADYKARRQIVGSFKDTPKTIGTSGVDIQAVFFGTGTDCNSACTTGTCTICSQIGNKITSVTWNATGQYKLNGIDGLTKYFCTGTTGGTNFQAVQHSRTNSTTSYAFLNTGSGATNGNGTNVSVVCIGVP
jgi:hypothetical protein